MKKTRSYGPVRYSFDSLCLCGPCHSMSAKMLSSVIIIINIIQRGSLEQVYEIGWKRACLLELFIRLPLSHFLAERRLQKSPHHLFRKDFMARNGNASFRYSLHAIVKTAAENSQLCSSECEQWQGFLCTSPRKSLLHISSPRRKNI